MSKEYTREEAITLIDTLWRKLAEKIEEVSSKSIDNAEESRVELYLRTAGGMFTESRKSAAITKVLLEYDNETIAKILSKSIKSAIALDFGNDLSEDFLIVDCEHLHDGAVDVAKYIVEEIKKNCGSNFSKIIKALLTIYKCKNQIKVPFIIIEKKMLGISPLVTALGIWTMQVRSEGPWDHKKKIKDSFASIAVKRPLESGQISESHYHKYKWHDYFYDVWSNIHYGYVGAFCGFSERILLDGAGIEQLGTYFTGKTEEMKNIHFIDALKSPRILDDKGDRECVALGIKLFKEYPDPSNLSVDVILNNLENMAQGRLGISRLVHCCFDSSEEKWTID